MTRCRRSLALVCLALGQGAVAALAQGAPTAEPARLVLLSPDRVLDGRGAVLEGASVLVRGERIEAVLEAGAADGRIAGADLVSLSGATLLPGLVDTHVHIDWHFDRTGRLATEKSGESPQQQVLYAMDNAWRTLLGGVTTAQSLGSPLDRDLREALERGVVPGPRLLTSLAALSERTGDPQALRAAVRERFDQGADVIKLFASASIRDGGAPTMTQEQLDAACGEARRLGLRAVVHAHGPESARRAVLAGCTSIEHGALLDRPTLELIASRGVYYDPNIDLVLRNYFENQEHFLGIGNYTEQGFDQMRQAVPRVLATFREALTVPGLKIVFGTDAVAGAHGRNAEELVARIVAGQDPGQAIVSATSLAAESLGLAQRIGSVRSGYDADLVAVDGNPLADPQALRRVVMVMRAGRLVLRPGPRP